MSYSSERVSMRQSLQRLQVLQMKTGGSTTGGKGGGYGTMSINSETDIEEKERLASMRPFARAEYNCAVQMREVRIQLALVEEMEKGKQGHYSQSEIIRAKQNARRGITKLNQHQKELQREGRRENKDAEEKECLRHIEKTKNIYRQVLGVVSSAEKDEEQELMGERRDKARVHRHQKLSGLADLDRDGGGNDGAGINQEFVSLRDDGEFSMFFQQVTQNDAKIDQALDRISAGIMRLNDQAQTIQQELRVHDILLDETEEKVNKVDSNLKGVNKRLNETLKKVDQDKMCIYLFCFLLLLGLVGGILVESGVIKK